MSVEIDTLLKLFDDAVSNGMEHAINEYGDTLTDEQKTDLRNLTPEQIKETLNNLLAAQGNLAKPAWFDTNNNNH